MEFWERIFEKVLPSWWGFDETKCGYSSVQENAKMRNKDIIRANFDMHIIDCQALVPFERNLLLQPRMKRLWELQKQERQWILAWNLPFHRPWIVIEPESISLATLAPRVEQSSFYLEENWFPSPRERERWWWWVRVFQKTKEKCRQVYRECVDDYFAHVSCSYSRHSKHAILPASQTGNPFIQGKKGWEFRNQPGTHAKHFSVKVAEFIYVPRDGRVESVVIARRQIDYRVIQGMITWFWFISGGRWKGFGREG